MNSSISLAAVRTLRQFAEAARVSFDRNLADRVIGESERSIPGSDWNTWAYRLVEAGEAMHLRIRSLETNIDDALVFVQEGVPVVVSVGRADESSNWTLITEASGSQVKVLEGADGNTERWESVQNIRERIRETHPDGVCTWVIGQAAMSCQPIEESPTGRRADHEPPISPLGRLIGLLRPEAGDLGIIGLFSFVVGILALAAPITVEALVNTVAFGRYLQPVLILALLLFVFLAFAGAMRALIAYVVEVLQRRLFVRVVEDLAYRLPRVRTEEFTSAHGPELVNRFFDVVTVQKTLSALLIDGVYIILQTVIGMAVLAVYHPFLLGFDIVLMVLIAVTVFGLGWGSIPSAIAESKKKYAIANWLQELARHATAFKLNSGSQFALDRADQLAIDWLDARRDHFYVVMRQYIFALGLQAVAATALMGIGGWLVIAGQITLGQLVASELIVMIIVGSFTKLGKHIESFYDLLASVDKLGTVFDLKIEPTDRLFHIRPMQPVSLAAVNLSYRFSSGQGLQPTSFEISPGDAVAIGGGPGSGKSTLVELIAGMRDADSGHIEFDGVDIRELRPDSLREHFSLSQQIEVFRGTIAENIHLGRANISLQDVDDALQIAELRDEIRTLPDGVNSLVQTNGTPLTTSQAARLMIARAVVGRPRLLVIDGTLDMIGDEIAERILGRLIDGDRPWTLLLVSNRDAVLNKCERVISLGDSLQSVANTNEDRTDSTQ